MKKQKITLILIFLLLMILLCGCSENSVSDKEKFVGTWRYEPEGFNTSATYVFYANGNYVMLEDPASNGTWDIRNDKLITTYLGMEEISYYCFSDNDKTVTLTPVNDPDFYMVLKKIS